MTRDKFEAAIAEFDNRVEQAIGRGSLEDLEALYAEAVAALDGEEPTDEEVVL